MRRLGDSDLWLAISKDIVSNFVVTFDRKRAPQICVISLVVKLTKGDAGQPYKKAGGRRRRTQTRLWTKMRHFGLFPRRGYG